MDNNQLAIAIKLKLKEAEKGLKELQRDFDQFADQAGHDIDRTDKKAKKLTGSIVKWGAGVLSLYLGFQMLSGGIQDTVRVGESFAATMSKVQAVSGATREEWLQLEQDALRLGSSTRYTATEVGQLQIEYSKLGFSAQEILKVAEGTLYLASATGEDLATSASVAGGVLRAYNYEADQTNRVTDVMAKLFSSSAQDLQKFKVGMSQSGTVSQQAGLAIEDTSALLGVLSDRNVRAETTGTGVRNILLMLNEEGSKLNTVLGGSVSSYDELIERLGLAAENEQVFEEAMKAVGRENAVVFSTLVENIDAVDLLRTGLQQADGSAKSMAKTMEDNLRGAMTEMKSATEGLQIQFFKTFDKQLTAGIRKITEFTQLTTEWIKQPMAEQLEQERIKLNGLVMAITTTNTNQELRNQLIQDLQDKYPDFLENLNTEALTNEDLADRLRDVNEQMIQNTLLKGKENELATIRKAEADSLDELIILKQKFGETIAGDESSYNLEIDKTRELTEQYQDMRYELENYAREKYGSVVWARDEVAALEKAYWDVIIAEREYQEAHSVTGEKLEEIIAVKKELGLLTNEEAAQYLSIEELMAKMTDEQKEHAQSLLDSFQGVPYSIEHTENQVRQYYLTTIEAKDGTDDLTDSLINQMEYMKEYTSITDYMNSVQKVGYAQAIKYNQAKLAAVEKAIESGTLENEELQKAEKLRDALMLKDIQLNDQAAADKKKTIETINTLDSKSLATKLEKLNTEEEALLTHLDSLNISNEEYARRDLEIRKFYADERVRLEAETVQKELDQKEMKAQREYELGLMSGIQYLQFLHEKDQAHQKMLADGLISEEKYDELKNEIGQQSLQVAMKRFDRLRMGFKEFLKGEAQDFLTAQQIKLFGKLAEIMAQGGATLGSSLVVSLPLYGLGIAALEIAKGKIAQLYTGVRDFEGGWAMTGEEGPELMWLPPGTDVYSHPETQRMLGESAVFNRVHNTNVANQESIANMKIQQDNDEVVDRLESVENAVRSIKFPSAKDIARATANHNRGRMN